MTPSRAGSGEGPDLTSSETDRAGRRLDIEGLRAVAVLCVLLYHAGLPVRAGYVGVDVFFVISGYLITGLLLRELASTGTIAWSAFVARRVRRLLPAAALVLVVTGLVSLLVVPGLHRRAAGLDIAWAAGYVVNWRLADRAVDYLAGGGQPSPVQHFWSLAVEEQYYLVWPLLILAAAATTAMFSGRFSGRSWGRFWGRIPGRVEAGSVGRPSRGDSGSGADPDVDDGAGRGVPPGVPGGVSRVLLGVLVVVGSLSFLWALRLGATEPERGYFVTTTRVWELGVGAAMAVLLGRTPGRLPAATRGRGWAPGLAGRSPAGWWHGIRRRPRTWVGWAGLGAIAAAATLLPDQTTWPNPWTLVPVVGAAAVIVAGVGHGPGPRGATVLLRWAPLVWVGGLSYSLYLWHWPMVVLADWTFHGLSGPARAGVVAASVLPAWASHRYVENPVRRSVPSIRPGAVVAAGAGLSLLAALSAVPTLRVTTPFQPRPAALGPSADMGAAALSARGADGPTAYDRPAWDWLVPDPEKAGKDRPDADVDHCQVDQEATRPVRCTFGDPSGKHTIALVGDSKAMQWLPALQSAAHGRFRIITYGKSSCAFANATTELDGRPYRSCDAWNAAVMDALRTDRPDIVVTSSAARRAWTGGHGSATRMVDGLAQRWAGLEALGIPVVVIGDNPASPDDLDVCADRHPRTLDDCAFDRGDAVRASALPVQRAARNQAPGTRLVDLTPWICPDRECPVAIGHVTVYRPGHHITATYAASLRRQVVPAVTRRLDRDPLTGR